MSTAKQKGDQAEYRVKALIEKAGFDCARTMLSEQAGKKTTTDLTIKLDNSIIATAQVKRRDAGFKGLRDWKGNEDILFLVEPRKPVLAVVDADWLNDILYDLHELVGDFETLVEGQDGTLSRPGEEE